MQFRGCSDVRVHGSTEPHIDSSDDSRAIAATWGSHVKICMSFNAILRALTGCPTGIDEYWSYSPAEINKVCLPLIAVFMPF